MKALGVYKREHRFVIDILAGMLADYDAVVAACEEHDYEAVFGDTDDNDLKDAAAEVFLSTLEDMK